jgi:hypothetical protein
MSALILKIIACVSMVLDHIGYFWGIDWLRIVGRLAFPIFVYLIYNGYQHTSHKFKYALRLAFFAVATQIPFNLFVHGKFWYNDGNVFFTLLAALIALWCVDAMRSNKVLRWFCLIPPAAICYLYFSGIFVSDYNALGVLMILVFYFCDHKGFIWEVLTAIGFFCAVYHSYLIGCAKAVLLRLTGEPALLPTLDSWELAQAWSACSLLLIFLYNGKKGLTPQNKFLAKLLQLGFYLFYPLHMVLLWFLSML